MPSESFSQINATTYTALSRGCFYFFTISPSIWLRVRCTSPKSHSLGHGDRTCLGSGRGTWDLLYSCTFTIFLCVYTAIHLNVPPEESGFRFWLRKTKWVFIAILAPEVVVYTAFEQWILSRSFLKDLNKIVENSTDEKSKVRTILRSSILYSNILIGLGKKLRLEMLIWYGVCPVCCNGWIRSRHSTYL
jgi:hypothetical protein